MMHYSTIDSPLGLLLIAADPTGLRLVGFQQDNKPPAYGPAWVEDHRPLRVAIQQLEAYFAGRLQHFTLHLAPVGTPFQQSVWRAVQRIPYGKTMSYGALAHQLGNPQAARAVGAANGRNPLAIVIPCHRVVGSTGKLRGYRGGIDLKKALLEFEHQHASDDHLPQPFSGTRSR